MNRAVEEMSFDYMLTEEELEDEIIPKIQDTVNAKWLQNMYSYSGSRKNTNRQKEFVKNEMQNYFVEIISNRQKIVTPKTKTFKWMSFKTKVSLFIEYTKLLILSLFNKNIKNDFSLQV